MSDKNNDNSADEELTDEQKVRFWLSNDAEDGQSRSGEWMQRLAPFLDFHSASSSLPHPFVTFTFTVQKEHCNRLGNFHGGAMASLFDFCTTMPVAIIGREGFWRFLGVSRTLNVTYLRPVPAGTEVLVECELLSIGKNMAAIRGILRRKSDGQILAVCEHNKVNIDPQPKL